MLPYYSENWVTGEVFPTEMLSLLYIASVQSLNAIQPLIIELSRKKKKERKRKTKRKKCQAV